MCHKMVWENRFSANFSIISRHRTKHEYPICKERMICSLVPRLFLHCDVFIPMIISPEHFSLSHLIYGFSFLRPWNIRRPRFWGTLIKNLDFMINTSQITL